MERRVFLITVFLMVLWLNPALGLRESKGAYIEGFHFSSPRNLIGLPRWHVVRKEETLLDIARLYDLGFNEIQDLYPEWDPWLPPTGQRIDIPSRWILPERLKEGILINTAELRLYYYNSEAGVVRTFPVGIGDQRSPTPEGSFRITSKLFKPTWTIPPSLRSKFSVKSIPPGPDNPLGAYWLGLNNSSYGIHGTNFPWSIGRLATRGCIRMYPEDIRLLFDIVRVGTMVKIIYKPVKIGTRSGKIFVEVHRDVYEKNGSMFRDAHLQLIEKGVADRVDPEKLNQALDRRSGMPVDVTRTEGSGQLRQ
jgi:L,D-transpeptidase ErfK/SrfK